MDCGLPLPLGKAHNLRSLVGLSNLVDLVRRCVEHPGAAGQTFLVSDGYDVSTQCLIRMMAKGMNRSPLLLPVPVKLLLAGGSLLGRRDKIDRLVNSLQIDIKHTTEKLDWVPPVLLEDGMSEMVRWYVGSRDTCT